MLVAVLFLMLPLLVACVLSFDARSFLGPFPPPTYSLRWYRAFLDNPAYIDGFWISLQLAVVAAALATVIGTAAALALADPRLRGRGALEAAFLSPKFVPTVVVGFSLLVFTAQLGLFDPFTRLVMGHTIITLPFTLRAVLASLVDLKRSHLEAAVSLGASEARALWDVAVPAARSGIVAGAAMRLL
jgi:putative spermidine/putrescine transport system permease protein